MEEREWREYEKRVVDAVKWCEERNEGPLVWSTVVGRLATAVPSPELGQVLVSHLCFDHNRPPLWKFIEKSLSSGLLFPIHVLSLLFARVIPNRSSQPKAYTVYLELLSRYALSFESLPQDVSKEKIIEDIDCALKLSQLYDVNIRTLELSHAFVLFLFRVIDGLIDVMLDDWGVVKTSSDRSRLALGTTDHTDMDVDSTENHNLENKVNVVGMRITNSMKAMEVLGKLTESKKAVLLLRLIHINMPGNFDSLQSKLQLLKAYCLSSSDSKPGTQLFAEFYGNIQRVVGFQRQLDKRHLMGMLIENGLRKPFSLCNFRSDFSACWIGFDLYLENALDGKQLPIKAVVDVLAESVKTLQIINQATWQETFLALWLSALRLVQRERDPLEGPIPHLETRLCILLSVVPLSIAKLLSMETQLNSNVPVTTVSGHKTGYGHDISGKARFPRKHGLVLALQVLGQFSTLVCPPESVVDAANTAATKAARFIRSSRNEDHGAEFDHYDQGFVKAGGNMIHLVVEACIARNLIDTSAYFWPDYVPASAFSPSEKTPVKSPWLVFLEGAPLSGHLVNSLISTPAPGLVEVEKLYNIALNGSEEEKPLAAKILCGASLRSGWNIQEHVVRFVVKLLSPPAPPNYSESRSHLVDYMPMLSVILYRASSIDMVHILSLHGAVPEVAASLMPLCEVFGSLEPAIQNKSAKKEEPSIYMVYSLAFLFLLRLWKFYRPPIEQCITEYARINGVELNLEYLLVLHNSRSIFLNGEKDSDKAVYIDSFPNLRSWYLQNKSCVSSPLSGLSTEKPAYQVANTILNMIYSKVTTSGTTSSLSSGSSSPRNVGEDVFQQTLHFPAWQVLEAMPFVLDALLAACSYQRISSRNMITGLRDLVDYLPATLAVIISYFSAEVTRGIWKHVPMNGIEWPSPAPVLQQVESEIKAILAAAGVDMPSCLPSFSSDGSEITLPLPMAVLVSLTITFKLDKNLEYIHAVAGPALENCASGCPWPGMAVVSCLWAQKVRRWHDFIVVSSSRSVFRHSKEAVGQLLRSCFSAYLGPVVQSPAATSLSSSPLSKKRGVDGLLGHVISSSVSPGFLYLRSCRTIQNVVLYVNDAIVHLVAEYARAGPGPMGSLGLTTARLREAAALGSSLVCISGGYRLVQELYTQTIPTWLLSPGSGGAMEGYAVACLAFNSGCLMWGLQEKLPKCIQIKRLRILGVHVNFLGQMLEGKAVGSNTAAWKAYVCCFVGQMVRFAPGWIPDLRQGTLRAVASGLKGWREYELALSLIEKGGIEAMGPAAELANVIGAGGLNR